MEAVTNIHKFKANSNLIEALKVNEMVVELSIPIEIITTLYARQEIKMEQNKLYRNSSRAKQWPIQGIDDIMIKSILELWNGLHSNIVFSFFWVICRFKLPIKIYLIFRNFCWI